MDYRQLTLKQNPYLPGNITRFSFSLSSENRLYFDLVRLSNAEKVRKPYKLLGGTSKVRIYVKDTRRNPPTVASDRV